MYAVIKTGGKQYKVAKDDEITVEKLAAEAGAQVQFNDVLMLGEGGDVSVGRPFLDDAGVQAEVVAQIRGEKVYSFKKRRRKHSSKRIKGHRQSLTVVKVTDILKSCASASGIAAALGAGSGTDVVSAPAGFAANGAAETAAPAVDAVEETAAAEGVRPANLLDAADGEADDLTQISGVGPKLNGLLNENGVYHFWQIAAWGADEIAYMDDKLSFKGRIERDGWIDQAKTLAEKAGDAAAESDA